MLLLLAISSTHSTIPSDEFSVAASIAGAFIVVGLLVGVLALRSSTIELWKDRLFYKSTFGRTTYAKQEIMSVGEDAIVFESNPLKTFLWILIRPASPTARTLYLTLTSKKVVWLREFSATRRPGAAQEGGAYGQLQETVEDIRVWLAKT